MNDRLVVVLAAVLATLTSVASARTTATTTIHVKEIEFRIVLSAKSAPRGTVIFLVKNIGYSSHDFRINGKTTPLIDPGKTVRWTARFTKAGKYPYRCTVDAHAAQGMRGVFTIR